MGSGENWFEILFKLWASISKMVLDGARKAEEVAKYLQLIVTNPSFITVLDRPPSANVDTSPADWRAEWMKFYKELFCIDADFSKVDIADDPGGFGWLVIVATGLTLNQVWAKCRDLFPCGSYYGDDLDKAVPKNDRTSAVTYAKRLRNRVEADEENENLSASTLAKQKIDGNTLLEGMLLELWFYWRTGGCHLNLVTVNLCAGSRDRGGGVPAVFWRDCQFYINYHSSDDACVDLRARSAV